MNTDSGKLVKSVHAKTGIGVHGKTSMGVHGRPESVFTLNRNMHLIRESSDKNDKGIKSITEELNKIKEDLIDTVDKKLSEAKGSDKSVFLALFHKAVVPRCSPYFKRAR